jgi:hypothetical protein
MDWNHKMDKYIDGSPVLGVVYEENDLFHYQCEYCGTLYSSPASWIVEMKAQEHESDHHQDK